MDGPELDRHDDEEVYGQLARLGKALSNPVRLRLLDLLEQGEHTVEELARAAQQPVKNTSAQLQQLRAAQLVETRREGVRIHYRLAGRSVSRFLGEFQTFAEETLAGMKVELDRLSRRPGGMRQISIKEFRQRL
ncbi:MAG TPA: metalloregulator ArsR/SmtB family transcription factor, partial [Microlunatus sp.]|nr:metalloregulator ArsR/SmtB family transcription factor [Microlunatus sp.]